MTCAAGMIATKIGATTTIDGCTACAIPTYSVGGTSTTCTTQICPAGTFANHTINNSYMLTDQEVSTTKNISGTEFLVIAYSDIPNNQMSWNYSLDRVKELASISSSVAI